MNLARSLRYFFVGSLAVAGSVAVANGPVGLWMTAGGAGELVQVNGAQTLFYPAANMNEYPIAVVKDIRTAAPGQWAGGFGANYDRTGGFTGTTYESFGLTVANQKLFYDGATDGKFNYGVNYGSLGGVYRTNRDWSNPVLLFPLGGFGDRAGITYDPVNRSLWISSYSTARIEQYSMQGALLSSFATPFNQNTCLAMDYKDGTLWFKSQHAQGRLFQYSRLGRQINTVFYNSLFGKNPLGAEFQLTSIQP